jgi:hypothetical protein
VDFGISNKLCGPDKFISRKQSVLFQAPGAISGRWLKFCGILRSLEFSEVFKKVAKFFEF